MQLPITENAERVSGSSGLQSFSAVKLTDVLEGEEGAVTIEKAPRERQGEVYWYREMWATLDAQVCRSFHDTEVDDLTMPTAPANPRPTSTSRRVFTGDRAQLVVDPGEEAYYIELFPAAPKGELEKLTRIAADLGLEAIPAEEIGLDYFPQVVNGTRIYWLCYA